VVHDIAYGDWVRQAGGVMFDKRFKGVTAEQLGTERAKEFIPWLRDVANARADSASGAQSEFLQELGAFARNRAAIAVMGMNLPAILPQVLDPWNAHQENVPAHHIAAAYVKVNSHMAGLIDMPEFALSKELAYRDAQLKDEPSRAVQRSSGPPVAASGARLGDRVRAVRALRQVHVARHVEGRLRPRAVGGPADAEAAARRRRGAPGVRLARHRGEAAHHALEAGLAALVMFYGFANRLYNSGRRSIADRRAHVRRPENATAGDKVTAVARHRLEADGDGAHRRRVRVHLRPRAEEGRGLEEVARVAHGDRAVQHGAVPGPAVQQLAGGRPIDIRTAPELALFQDVFNQMGGSVKNILETRGSRADQEKLILSVEALIGAGLLAAGTPVGQVKRTGGYVQKLATGEARPRNAADVASGLVYGQQENQGRNPLSDLGDALGR
jgi:hypothetical protein